MTKINKLNTSTFTTTPEQRERFNAIRRKVDETHPHRDDFAAMMAQKLEERERAEYFRIKE